MCKGMHVCIYVCKHVQYVCLAAMGSEEERKEEETQEAARLAFTKGMQTSLDNNLLEILRKILSCTPIANFSAHDPWERKSHLPSGPPAGALLTLGGLRLSPLPPQYAPQQDHTRQI
jgi:hypothetical protein